MSLKDSATGYGWLSIFLHWFTAIAVIVLLFVGDSISGHETPDARDDAVLRHTSIAISCYLFLWARVIYRFVAGHPGPLPTQRGFFFHIGKFVHYVLLIALAAMLISGPLMVWFGGTSIGVWDWFSVPGPFEQSFAVRDALLRIHQTAAITILVLTVAHIGGVYKHAAFNQDGTFTKMLVPQKARTPAAPTGSGSTDAGERSAHGDPALRDPL